MKKIWVILALLAVAFAPLAFAGDIDVQEDGALVGRARAINFSTGLTASAAAGTATIVADVSAFSGGTITGVVDATGMVLSGASPLVLEGTTADAYETTIAVTDPTADRTITIPNKSGQVQLASAASVITAGTTPTLTVGLSNVYTLTPTDNQDETITFSGAGTAGDILTIVITTTGTADEVITFHSTLVSSAGTITAGTTAARKMVISFLSDGSKWNEIARTAELT